MTDSAAALEAVAKDILQADVCPNLRATATQLVPGEGNSDADVLFVGEAPGAREDKDGRPFVGAAGKFLDEMLSSVGIERKDVFITNIVKYRPPANRDPEPDEIRAFWPYLERQIAIIQPKLIVLLGRHALNVFLPELRISAAHGRPVRKSGRVYLPLFHPAAALYNGGLRQSLIDDFAIIPALLAKIDNPKALRT